MAENSTGVTATERMLAEFGERSFLKLWSYPNPYKDDGHELCDLLAVFGNYVFIFFDREKELSEASGEDALLLWERWKRNAIDRQVKTAHGAERYIRSGRPIFLDGKRGRLFPFEFDREHSIVHKIIVAHGAKEACKLASPENVYGSLAISYAEKEEGLTSPFHVWIDKNRPVHVLDSHNMPIVLQELNTVRDFAAFLDEKIRAIAAFDFLCYCGEEDLLAHYMLNYDEVKKRHIIGPKIGSFNGVMVGEGEWHDFIQTNLYKNTKDEDRISYFWDELIQRTCQNSLDGTLGGNSDILRGHSAIYEMVKEPRFVRRGIAKTMLESVASFPDGHPFARKVTLMPSFEANVAYVLLQVRVSDEFRTRQDYREKRRTLLQIACGAAKNKFPHFVKIIGIGIDAPKFSGGINAEDFILMECEPWSNEKTLYYQELNKDWNFFGTSDLKQFENRVTQLVPRTGANERAVSRKTGRNEICPCGSGKKYKNCHGLMGRR